MKIMFLPRKAAVKILIATVVSLVMIFGAISYLKSLTAPASTYMEPIYQGKGDQKEIALTVNVDWGEEYIPKMLDVFETKGAKVTFFLSGKWVEKNPDVAKKIKEAGHEIGNHGYSHPHPDNLSIQENIEEIKKTEKVIKETLGVTTNLFAPPYGEKKEHVVQAASQIGYKTIYWSLDTIDWQNPKPATIVERIVPRAFNGAIVLMHPKEPTVLALPEIIHKLQEQEYKFVTISQIIN